MQKQSFFTKNRIIVISIIFMVINTLCICLIFNTEFFFTNDRKIWSSRFDLITFGICLALFFICYKFLEHLTIKKLFLIFIIIRIAFFFYFTLLNYSAEIDFESFALMAQRILDGDLFTPYSQYWWMDGWRMYPPLHMWWYTYNYWVYELNLDIWRLLNVLLEIGIVFVMIKIFEENKNTEAGWNEDHFKIGLSFYIFSIFPIYTIILQAHITAFPVLLAMIGFLYYFRSKTDSRYLYHAIFFFSLGALALYFTAIWILGILLCLLFQQKFKRLVVLSGEVVVIFCLGCLPMLINDALGFMERLFWVYSPFMLEYWNGSIWAINHDILGLLPAILAISLCSIYIYKNYKQEIGLDFFIVILSIFFFFSPQFCPWYYLWIFPFISISIIYSFRKYFITNLFFLGFFFFFMLLFAIAFLTYPNTLSTNWIVVWGTILPYMETNGFFLILQLFIHLLYYIGFIYLIYAYTKSKQLLLGLIVPFAIFYAMNFFI